MVYSIDASPFPFGGFAFRFQPLVFGGCTKGQVLRVHTMGWYTTDDTYGIATPKGFGFTKLREGLKVGNILITRILPKLFISSFVKNP